MHLLAVPYTFDAHAAIHTHAQTPSVRTGDVCTILRVHRFLDDWGFINSDAKRPDTVAAAHFHSTVLADEHPAFM